MSLELHEERQAVLEDNTREACKTCGMKQSRILFYTLYRMPSILSIGFIDNIENDQILAMADADIDNDILHYHIDKEVNLSTFVKQVPPCH